MARHTSRRRSRGRRRHRRSRRGTGTPVLRLAGWGVGGLGVAALVAATLPSAVAFIDRPEAPQVAAAAPVAEPLVRGAIVDPSGSNGGARSADQDVELLADVVAEWPGSKPPDDGTSAYGGMPGLDLTVRQVALNSYAANAEVAHILLPSVPPLPPMPATTDVNASAAFLDQVDAVQKQYQRAQAKAERAASTLRSAQLRSENSEIAGALSALVQVLPPSSNERGVVVISDLEQAGADPEVDGDLSDTTVTVFQRCDEGVDRCTQARESFTDLTRKLNGAAPEFRRIETLPSNLSSILKGE